jgi:hypothetical protein
MTAVTERPVDDAPAVLRHDLPGARRQLIVVNGLLVVLSVAIGATISIRLGLLALALTAVIALCDAQYHTPSRIWVDATHVVLGYWMRSKRFSPRSVVLRHDVRHDRFVLVRRRKRRRRHHTLVRFRDRDTTTVTRAFMAAGVEIVSR